MNDATVSLIETYLPGRPVKTSADEERLRREALEPPRSGDGRLVLLGQLVDPEDRDDVLEVAVALEDALRLARDVVVLLPDDERVEDAGGRGQRVDRRVDAQLGDVALEADRGVEVGEGRRRRRVGVVVGGDEDRLERGDRALLGRGDPLLQAGHLGGEVRLVADRGRHAPEERRHLGAGLGEPEDVVDEQEDVAALLVAEVLGHRQAGEADALARAGRLVHLAEHEGRLGDDARLGHLVDEVVALAAPLADAGEHRHAGVLLGDVPDQLLDDDRLADAGAAEDADLAALLERADEVDDLEAGLEDLDLGGLVLEGRRVAVDREVDLGASTGPFRSIGLPRTSNTRPRVASPTGTVIGPPVSRTSVPRARPSVVVMATRADPVVAEVLRRPRTSAAPGPRG